MEWKEAYNTGVPELDDQHRMLFRIVEEFQATMEESRGARAYGSFLDVLTAYAKAHFAREEACMAAHRCPVAGQNQAAHQGLLRVLEEHRQHYAAHGFDEPDARKLCDVLTDWLLSHICGVDVHLKKCVAARAKKTLSTSGD